MLFETIFFIYFRRVIFNIPVMRLVKYFRGIQILSVKFMFTRLQYENQIFIEHKII